MSNDQPSRPLEVISLEIYVPSVGDGSFLVSHNGRLWKFHGQPTDTNLKSGVSLSFTWDPKERTLRRAP